MTYVVGKDCLDHKDKSCVEVCPVDCFYDIADKKLNDKYNVPITSDDSDSEETKKKKYGLLVIDPDECIHCGACQVECPFEAIQEDSDADEEFLKLNEELTVNLTEEERDEKRCTS